MALQVWLPLNGDLHNQGLSREIQGYQRAGTHSFVNGKVTNKALFTGNTTSSTNDVALNSNLLNILNNTSSVSVWIMPLGNHPDYNGTIITSGNWNTANGRWAFGVSQDNSQVDVLCGNYNTYITCAIPINQWTNLISTYDNGKCKLYKNGIYIGELNNQNQFYSDTTITSIGKCTYGQFFGFNGYINDLRIYDHCLSNKEVDEIAKGSVLHYQLNQSNQNLITEETYSITPWSDAIQAHEIYQGKFAYRVTNNILYSKTGNGANNIFPNVTYLENTQYTMSVDWRDDYRTDNKSSSLYLRFHYTDGTYTQIISPANSKKEWTHSVLISTAGKTVDKCTTTYGNGGQLYLTNLK